MTLIGEVAASVAADQLVDLAKKEGWFKNIINAFKKEHNILVLGTTGAGKTNFINSLTEYMPEAIDFMNRTEVMKKNSITITKQLYKIYDTPGQEAHKPRRMKAIIDSLEKNKTIIINVVANGYHEYRRSPADVFDQSGNVKQSYLDQHREVEIRALDEWTSFLGSRELVRGLITVVTKADLWWRKDSWNNVVNHYSSGQYFNSLGEAKNLDPSVIPYCSVFHKFYNQGLMTGEFDESDRINFRFYLLNLLLSMIGKG